MKCGSIITAFGGRLIENERRGEKLMTEHTLPLATFYKGWDAYQQLLIAALAPLSLEQLALQASPHHWSMDRIAAHIIAARVWWFQNWMGGGEPELASFTTWDDEGEPLRSAAELVTGLEATWQMIQDALARWTVADLEQTFYDPRMRVDAQGERLSVSRQWIIWHVIEHDLHHGGELSLSLGMHGLAAPDL